jgi:type IV pilus biogenesis protein CpaD/CtpE
MKARIVLFVAVLALAASCTSYRTCATYAKHTAPATEQPAKKAV